MISIICDKCGRPAGNTSYIFTVEVLHNPVPLRATDRGNVKLTDVDTQYKMCMCSECYEKIGFPNPYEVEQSGIIEFKNENKAETREEARHIPKEVRTEAPQVEQAVNVNSIFDLPEVKYALYEDKGINTVDVPLGVTTAANNVDFVFEEVEASNQSSQEISTTPNMYWFLGQNDQNGTMQYYSRNSDYVSTYDANEAALFEDSTEAINMAIELNKKGYGFTAIPYSA